MPPATLRPILVPALAAALLGRPRSFRADAAALAARLRPPLRVFNREHIPTGGPCLITINHYTSPKVFAAWPAIAVSAASGLDICWVLTSAWTFEGSPAAAALAPLSRRIFLRLSRVYGFERMPPAQPALSPSGEGAAAVRRLVDYARSVPNPVIGLAPEGRDFPGARLGWPPPGAGRLALHLSRLGLVVTPAGAFEQDGALCLRFGAPYRLDVPPNLANSEQDRAASRAVMARIAALLPEELRGEFNETP